jgi:hypothetical protein
MIQQAHKSQLSIIIHTNHNQLQPQMQNDVRRIWFAILTVVGKIMGSDLCGLVESTIGHNKMITHNWDIRYWISTSH